MIENDLQLEVTKDAIEKFRRAIEFTLRGQYGTKGNIDPLIYIAMLEGYQATIDDLQEQVDDYYHQRLIRYGLIDPTLDNSEKV